MNDERSAATALEIELLERLRQAEKEAQDARVELEASRRRADEAIKALAESENRYRIMGDTIPFGVWWCNAEGGAEYASPSFLELLNMSWEEFREFGWTQRLPPEDVEPMMTKWLRCVHTGEPWDDEHRIYDRHGQIQTVLTRGLPVHDDKTGAIQAWVGVNLDITARKRMEVELTQAKGALEQALHIKDQFLANISHELRTPLTLILGPTRALQGASNLTDEQRHDLAVVEKNARSLLRTVNNLLDLSKLDAGRMEADYAEIDFAWMARWVAAHFETIGEDRRIHFDVRTPETVPGHADPEKLERVLFNLLSNAFKFTPAGGSVRLLLDLKDDRAEFHVEDNGPGVAKEMREIIFERFRQIDASATRGFGGTGLGLSIVKEFIHLHHGRVAVDDAPGGGARFTVAIPLHAPAGSTVKEAPPPMNEERAQTAVAELKSAADRPTRVEEPQAPEAALVLVVEDNPEMNAFVASSLRPRYRVATARDGQEGLEKALLLRPDLIISDIMMPRRSGEDLVREVRRHREMEDVPILLLSARADEESRIRLLSSGAQDYLIKPFVTEELLARAAGLVQRKREAEAKLRENHALLKVAHAQLQEASRRKDEFLAMLSHELRNPLAAITSAIHVLQRRGSADPSLSRVHALAARQTAHLARLLNDLLDVARITQGKVTLEKERTSVAEILESAIERTEPLIREREHHLSVSLPEEALCLEADPVRLAQAVGNALDNAARYTPDGGEIHLSAGQEDGQAVVRVRDNGAGMAPELLPQVFDLFVQGERSLDRKESGLGVGLTITRTVVDLHGGHVEAHSEGQGKGSELVIRLPLADCPKLEGKVPGTTNAAAQTRRRVLLVEDNADASGMLAGLLEMEGHEVAEARSGPDALEKATRFQPDVAFIDIGMPGMDGYVVAHHLREDAVLSRVVLVALTGYGADEDKQRARAAGFHTHLTKPVSLEALQQVLRDAGDSARQPV